MKTKYEIDGKIVEIKFSKHYNSGDRIMIKFKHFGCEHWFYHIPNKELKNKEDITNFLLSNIESPHVIFKVMSNERKF